MYTSGIEVRTRCASSTLGESTWDYQFRSRFDAPIDFSARVEHSAADSSTNQLGPATLYEPQGGEHSSVFHTQMHGTCEKVRDLKVVILCSMDPGTKEDCAKSADGQQLDYTAFRKPAKSASQP